MTAEIIELQFGKVAKREGNGAREMLIALVLDGNDVMTAENAGNWADWVLAESYARGFKVVPL